jgi:hypothetical protein
MPEELKKKKQTMRYSDEELRIIKSAFAENDDLLRIIRKVFLQIPLDAVEMSVLVSLQKEVLGILRKTILPTIEPNAPLHQVIDLWMTIDLKDKSPSEAKILFESRKKLIDYLDQQLEILEGKRKRTTIKFAGLEDITEKTTDEMFIDMMVRNTIITHMEMQLDMLSRLAGLKEETPDQTMERLKKDSTK